MIKKSYYTGFLNLQYFVQGKDTHYKIDADGKVEHHSKALIKGYENLTYQMKFEML